MDLFVSTVFPFLNHEGSGDIQLLAIDWVTSAMMINENIAKVNLKKFKESIEDWIPKKGKHLANDSEDDYQINDDENKEE